ncbi:hypothetical protein FJT64_025220 [Amphibalanus amphitrite]|uniref:Uncharacterized protein n=1 Tax=Amphibalanus amphitrite TaxID=1232801 RepID=A0A6A4WGB2_AMPAM|nr:hypothetical protein FJT64_025220 [Amphibalanus amphitrite]
MQSDYRTGLGSAIADAMERRQRTLFECDAFLAAVCIDVRYRLLLDEGYIRQAERAFTSVVHRERQLRRDMERPSENRTGQQTAGATGSKNGSGSSEDELERDLDALQQQRQQKAEEQQPSFIEDPWKSSCTGPGCSICLPLGRHWPLLGVSTEGRSDIPSGEDAISIHKVDR